MNAPSLAVVGDAPTVPEPEPEEEHEGRQLVSSPGAPLPNVTTFVAESYLHRGRKTLRHQSGVYWTWDRTQWTQVEKAALEARLYTRFHETWWKDYVAPEEFVEVPFNVNRKSVGDLVGALAAHTHLPSTVAPGSWISGEHEEPASEFVAAQNGLIHWPTRTLTEPTPELFNQHSVPYAFDPEAPPPERWLRFLKELWPDDLESHETLQEMFGYIVSGDTSHQKMFALIGPKRAGKGTIARLLENLLGQQNVVGTSTRALSSNFGAHSLIGKPLAVIPDARLQRTSEEVVERLLNITGEDTVAIDRKGVDAWNGRLPTRLLMLSNEVPRLPDASGALASRFIIFRMTESFLGREDRGLDAALSRELPAILNWALDGLDRLQERGRFIQPDSGAELVRDMEDLGSPTVAFVRDRCVVGPGHSVLPGDIYIAWQGWCGSEGRDKTGTKATMGKNLKAAVPGIRMTKPRDDAGRQVRMYSGIRLKTDDD